MTLGDLGQRTAEAAGFQPSAPTCRGAGRRRHQQAAEARRRSSGGAPDDWPICSRRQLALRQAHQPRIRERLRSLKAEFPNHEEQITLRTPALAPRRLGC
jgi:hypothetical protein